MHVSHEWKNPIKNMNLNDELSMVPIIRVYDDKIHNPHSAL